MRITTAKGTEFECSAITSIPSPKRLYLHIVNTTIETVRSVFLDPEELPIKNYPAFDTVQSISSEGYRAIKVSLKKS